ncbi:MAG: sulfite exporter TauE/SafE family protein [Symbiobacteriia bacterium]
MADLLKYVLVGGLIGFMSGIFGVGGSSIGTPILNMLFHVPDLIALASPLPVTIPTAVSSAYSYWRKGLVRKDVALWASLAGLPGVVLGALGTRVITGPGLMVLTGVFVLIVGGRLLVRDRPAKAGGAASRFSVPVLSGSIGLVVGLLSGLLANGGGFLLVPAFILLLGMSMQEAASTSLVCVAFYAVPGTLVHWWLGNINWLLAFALSVGVIPAGYLGSRVGLAVRGDRTRVAFGLFLSVFGVDFILQHFGLKAPYTYLLLVGGVVAAVSWVVAGVALDHPAEGGRT